MDKNLKTIKYKLALMKAGFSQKDVADFFGVSESYISMIIAGKRENKKFENWIAPLIDLEGVIL